MSELVGDQEYWIGANGADDPEAAGIILAALVSPGDWGTFTVRQDGQGKIVQGPVSSLKLADEDAEMAFMARIEEISGDEEG